MAPATGMSAWSGLDEFVAVAQGGGFSRAARKLGCSTSQVSREVAGLENRLGVRLFYRTTRHVSLTDAGQQFLERCRKLIEDRDEAIAALTSEEGELHGHLRVTCSVAYGERFLVPLVSAFMLRHPRLSVHIELIDAPIDIVAEGFDLAIRLGELIDSSMVARRLSARTRRLCAAPSYLSARGVPKELADLAGHDCLRGTAETWAFRVNGEPVAFKPIGRWRCNGGGAVVNATLQGLGICQLPDFYVQEHLGSGALVSLLDELAPADEGVWALYAHRRHLAPKVSLLVEFLQSRLEALPSQG